jgi:hypothetical protein
VRRWVSGLRHGVTCNHDDPPLHPPYYFGGGLGCEKAVSGGFRGCEPVWLEAGIRRPSAHPTFTPLVEMT